MGDLIIDVTGNVLHECTVPLLFCYHGQGLTYLFFYLSSNYATPIDTYYYLRMNGSHDSTMTLQRATKNTQ